MTRRKFARRTASLLALVAMACTAAPSAAPPDATRTADAADAGWILQRLARPAPTRTDFVELRGSPLLKAPLRIEGEYRRPDTETLVRAVRTPYVETTTIRGGEANIERSGKVRRFSLSRAPELQGLQASFGAMLAGDRVALERHYRIAADGTRQHWSLTLVPREQALATKVRDIVLRGRGAELRCIETRPVKGDLQRTLLAGAARDARGVTGADALAALCRAQ
jgi:hypothetical protein